MLLLMVMVGGLSKLDLNAIKEAYSEGYTDVEVMAKFGITKKVFQQFYTNDSGFAEYIDHCRTLSQAWWISKARENLWSKEFNSSMWAFNMKNRYAWADKVETTTKDADNLDHNELETRLAAKLPGLAKQLSHRVLTDSDIQEKAKNND